MEFEEEEEEEGNTLGKELEVEDLGLTHVLVAVAAEDMALI